MGCLGKLVSFPLHKLLMFLFGWALQLQPGFAFLFFFILFWALLKILKHLLKGIIRKSESGNCPSFSKFLGAHGLARAKVAKEIIPLLSRSRIVKTLSTFSPATIYELFRAL